MPLPDLGPQNLESCNSIGSASAEYARDLARESGKSTTTVRLPDGSKVEAVSGLVLFSVRVAQCRLT